MHEDTPAEIGGRLAHRMPKTLAESTDESFGIHSTSGTDKLTYCLVAGHFVIDWAKHHSPSQDTWDTTESHRQGSHLSSR